MILQRQKDLRKCFFNGFMTSNTNLHTDYLYLLTELMLGTLSSSHTPSSTSLSRISQANMVGLLRFSCRILWTTVGVATLGLEPPIRPGRTLPVSLYLQRMNRERDQKLLLPEIYFQLTASIKMRTSLRR